MANEEDSQRLSDCITVKCSMPCMWKSVLSGPYKYAIFFELPRFVQEGEKNPPAPTPHGRKAAVLTAVSTPLVKFLDPPLRQFRTFIAKRLKQQEIKTSVYVHKGNLEKKHNRILIGTSWACIFL